MFGKNKIDKELDLMEKKMRLAQLKNMSGPSHEEPNLNLSTLTNGEIYEEIAQYFLELSRRSGKK